MAEDSSRLHSGDIQLASIPMLEDQSNWEDWIRNGTPSEDAFFDTSPLHEELDAGQIMLE
jgi:hypothetical protein